jgi:hypothetical protein
MHRLWTTGLPESLTASHALVFDPLTDCVYVADGWGTAYASLCLRRLSLSSGSITAAVVVRAGVFSACLDPQSPSLLVAAGARLIEVERRTCAVVRSWKTGVPKNSHHSALIGRTALLMGWLGPSLSIFDLESGHCRRTRLGSCQAMLMRKNGRVLVCSGYQGVIHEFDPVTQRVLELMQTGPFVEAAYCADADALVLAPGVPFELTDNSIKHTRNCDRITIIRIEDASTLDFPGLEPFDSVWASSDALRLFVAKDGHMRVYERHGPDLTLRRKLDFSEGFESLLVIPERSIALAADRISSKGRIEAWSL